jgi:hypothetical protein
MRIAAFILATYIAFLTPQPMMSPADACSTTKVAKKLAHSCCEKKESKQSQKQNSKECPCSGVCNPFGQGTCCLGFLSPLSFQFLNLASAKDFNSLTSVNWFSNYLADCFHPPEVV